MHCTTKYIGTLVCLLTLNFFSCKKWDDRISANNPSLGENLLEEFGNRANLSKFKEYLVKTGLDKTISSSKTYTVWAPVNEALQTLDPAVVNDSLRLRLFVANHISNQAHYTAMAQPGLRVPLLNGKRSDFSSGKFDEANITAADFTVGNGVLHVLDKAVAPLPNLWEFVKGSAGRYQQNFHILSDTFKVRDDSGGILDSISATTGERIYKPGTDSVLVYRFNQEVFDLNNEDKLYTYFVLNDAAFKTEVDSLLPFYKTGRTDSTYKPAVMNVVKDAVVEGLYPVSQLPASLTSKFGVFIPVDRNAIIETRRVSNGIVHIVNKLNFSTRQKIPDIIIQGEQPNGFFLTTGEPVNVRGATFYRIRKHPVTGQLFNDLFLYNHGLANLNVLYQVSKVPSVRYKVFWVAVNDTLRVSSNTINPSAFMQRLAIGNRTATNFAYRSVTANLFSEVELGEYIQPSFGSLSMFLTAANSTTAGANSLTLDYIRLEPQL